MKTIKTLALIILSGMISISVAQIRIGPMVGLNIPNVSYKDNSGKLSTKSILAYQVGATVELQMSKFLSLEPSLMYTVKGFKYSATTAGLSYDYNSKVNYLELPVNLRLKIGIKALDVVIYAGPYAAYAISGTVKSSGNLGSNSRSLNIGTDEVSDDIKPYDFGINYGAGVELRKIYFGAQYSTGMANLSPSTKFGEKELNNVAALLISYKFGKKR